MKVGVEAERVDIASGFLIHNKAYEYQLYRNPGVAESRNELSSRKDAKAQRMVLQ